MLGECGEEEKEMMPTGQSQRSKRKMISQEFGWRKKKEEEKVEMRAATLEEGWGTGQPGLEDT